MSRNGFLRFCGLYLVEKRLNDLLDRAMALVTALDLMEADCDLEDSADHEASLGWPDRRPGS